MQNKSCTQSELVWDSLPGLATTKINTTITWFITVLTLTKRTQLQHALAQNSATSICNYYCSYSNCGFGGLFFPQSTLLFFNVVFETYNNNQRCCSIRIFVIVFVGCSLKTLTGIFETVVSKIFVEFITAEQLAFRIGAK